MPHIARHNESAGSLDQLVAEFARTAAEYDETSALPLANFNKLKNAGFLGAIVPRTHGGWGGTLADAARIIQAIGQGEPATALILAMQYTSLAAIQNNPWPDSTRNIVFKAAVEDGALFNMLRVEPDLGTPLRGGIPATIARKVVGGWRISGRKIYSTGSPILTWGIVWARTDEVEPRIGNFLVPIQNVEGVHIETTWNHLGLRASGSNDVVLDDLFIPDDHACDVRLPANWTSPNEAGAVWVAVLLGALYTGVARAAQRWTVDFLKGRTPSNLGQPLSSLPRMQQAIGENEVRFTANQLLLESASLQWNERRLTTADANAVKTITTGNAVVIVERLLSLTGNHGLSRNNPLERHYRDVLCSRVHSPQEDWVHLRAGQEALS